MICHYSVSWPSVSGTRYCAILETAFANGSPRRSQYLRQHRACTVDFPRPPPGHLGHVPRDGLDLPTTLPI
jgi:hypothetical protein